MAEVRRDVPSDAKKVPFTWRWRGEVLAGGPCALVDIDGVLADGRHRQRFMESRPRDYEAFFGAAHLDTPIVETAVLVGLMASELAVVLVTGRPFRIRQATRDWLEEHRFRWDLLVLRPDDDRRPTQQYKRSCLHRLWEYGFAPVLALDDEPGNVAMYRAEGVPCLYVHSGYYDAEPNPPPPGRGA